LSKRSWEPAGFFNERENRLEFPEILQHCNPSFSYSVNNALLSNRPFFNEALLSQEVQVLFQDAAVHVGFVHYMSKFERPTLRQNFKNINVHFKLGASHI